MHDDDELAKAIALAVPRSVYYDRVHELRAELHGMLYDHHGKFPATKHGGVPRCRSEFERDGEDECGRFARKLDIAVRLYRGTFT